MQRPTGLARFGALLAALALTAGLVFAAPVAAEMERAGRGDIRGLWIDHRDPQKRKVAVWIEECDGLLCGHIYWLRKPLANGRPKRDHRNPDARLRDRPLCGLRILSGFKRAGDGGTWSAGQIYNPGDGRTFSSTMTLEGDGGLRISGYFGVSLLGKTVQWIRPQEKPGRCG